MFTDNEVVTLILLRHILFRYPLTILYLMVLFVMIKYRKSHFNHPFYVYIFSLALAHFMFSATNEFYSIRCISADLIKTTAPFYAYINNFGREPSVVAIPGLELLMSFMRIIAIAFPLKFMTTSKRAAFLIVLLPWAHGIVMGILVSRPDFTNTLAIINGTEQYVNGVYGEAFNQAYLYSTVFMSMAAFGVCCLAALLLFKQTMKIQPASTNGSTGLNLNKEMKMVLQTTLVTVVTTAAHLYAYISTSNWTVAYHVTDYQWHLKFFLFDSTVTIEPLIYLAVNGQLRRLFLKRYFCCFSRFQQNETTTKVFSMQRANSVKQ